MLEVVVIEMLGLLRHLQGGGHVCMDSAGNVVEL